MYTCSMYNMSLFIFKRAKRNPAKRIPERLKSEICESRALPNSLEKKNIYEESDMLICGRIVLFPTKRT